MNMGSSHRTKATTCPTCKRICNGATQASGPDERPDGPEAGDITICASCLEVCMFTEDMDLEIADQSLLNETDKMMIGIALKQMQGQKRIH